MKKLEGAMGTGDQEDQSGGETTSPAKPAPNSMARRIG